MVGKLEWKNNDTERWKQMNKWKIGASVGRILGLTVSYIPMMWIFYAGPPATYWSQTRLWWNPQWNFISFGRC